MQERQEQRSEPLPSNQPMKLTGACAPAAYRVRPARTSSWGCKSPRKETIPIEANRNCERVTNRGEEAGSETVGR